MKCSTVLITRTVVLVLFFLIFPHNAYAYLDPGTASYILQLIVAVLFGALLAVKIFWSKIKIFFKNLFARTKKHEKTED